MNQSRASGPSDHSGVWIPPPLIYVAAFALALALQKFAPLPAPAATVGRYGGAFLIGVGAALAVWSLGLFHRARTSVVPVRPTTALVVGGPYRFTRNPMYLALLNVYVGVALLMHLLWALLLLPALILAVQRLAIRKEERYLERKFGSEYTRYKARVRRWL